MLRQRRGFKQNRNSIAMSLLKTLKQQKSVKLKKKWSGCYTFECKGTTYRIETQKSRQEDTNEGFWVVTTMFGYLHDESDPYFDHCFSLLSAQEMIINQFDW